MRAYTKKGPVVVALNHKMVDAALGNLVKIDVPAAWGTVGENQSILDVVYDRPGVRRGEEDNIPGFITNIMDPVLALEGDKLPVSAMTPGGYMESGTCEFEKRGIAPEIPVWIGDTCTQCNYCAIVCPHAVVRPFLLDKAEAKAAPADFEMRKAQGGAETADTSTRSSSHRWTAPDAPCASSPARTTRCTWRRTRRDTGRRDTYPALGVRILAAEQARSRRQVLGQGQPVPAAAHGVLRRLRRLRRDAVRQAADAGATTAARLLALELSLRWSLVDPPLNLASTVARTVCRLLCCFLFFCGLLHRLVRRLLHDSLR